LGIAARQRYPKDVIAITGTAGKSTTVKMLQHMLGGPTKTLASIDNYNSRVGAPSMLANLSPDYEAAIIEVAQSALWMKRGPITRLVQPTIALITEIGMSQTDARVKSVEDTAKWKSKIFDGLTGNAIAIIGEHLTCFDYVMDIAQKHAKRIIRFGTSESAEIKIADINNTPNGSNVKLITPDGILNLHIPIPGMGMINNAVAAICVLYAMEKDLVHATHALKSFLPEEGRLQCSQIKIPNGHIDLIDDSWNATVSSMLNAFSVFKSVPVKTNGRKIAVLGRIVHLGPLAQSLHESLAEPLLDTGVNLIITHGDEMHYLRALLPKNLLGPHFSSVQPLVDYLHGFLQDQDLVLVKGSRRDSDFGQTCELLKNVTI
jgi:UDP-N-acetylmuramyl pentapeptide synthase